MRVGLIANTFDDAVGSAAGGNIHFIEIAKRWGDLDLTVFAPQVAASAIALDLPRATFVHLPNIDRLVRNRQIRYLARMLMSLLRAKELRSCDVLLATSHFMPDVVPALIARRGRFIICIQHILDPPSTRAGNPVANAITYVMQALALRITATLSPAVLVNDDETAKRIGIVRARTDVTIMSNGTEHVTHDSPPVAIDARTRAGSLVLYLGRIVPTKGVDDLLRAWVDVSRAVPEARLVIAGSGEGGYEEALRRQALSAGIDATVEFVGRVSDDEKRRLLGNASVFAFPSKEEGWGIVLAEAMAYGLPCVTYDLAAFRKPFVAGRVIVPIGDTSAFAKRVIELLTDESRRSMLSEEARSLSGRFSWAAAAETERLALLRLAQRSC